MFIGWIKGCITSSKCSISVNGSLVGYFEGARGVRQGDPFSPYIFVLAMNVLSKLLDIAVSNGVFSYHPKCKRIKLTHLCFIDDLLIFTKERLDSIVGIQNVMHQFFLFSSGISREEFREKHQGTGFKIDTFPIRYLGVPLVTRRLTDKDCNVLVGKISSRISHWVAKFCNLFLYSRL